MDGELLSLKWNNHRTTFYHVISGLRNKETYTDVTLACEGKFYPVHKLVLSTCSEYFSDIFDRTPCKNPVVVLKDINCQDLEFLLDYMYIGEVNVRQNELSSLIKAAECLRIKGLAVPDEEPKKNGGGGNSSNNTGVSGQGRQRPELASPPAKRRRAEERRVIEQSPGRPPGDGSPDQEGGGMGSKMCGDVGRSRDHVEDKQSDVSVEQPPVHIKVEQHDNYEQSANDDFLVQSNSYEGGGSGGGGGAGVSVEEGEGPHSSEGNTNDFPEFLQSTVEKEEPVAMSDFNPSDFPGPSGLQNSGMATWEGDNSSTSFTEGISGAVAAAVAAATQPQQQRQQQQQLWTWSAAHSQTVAAGGDKGGLGSGVVEGGEGGIDNCSGNAGIQLRAEPTNGGRSGLGGHHVCHVCGYTAQRRQHLENHIRTHTGERPHQCPQCNYRCSDISNLKKHVRIHSNGKPVTCPYCTYSTIDTGSLKKHWVARSPWVSGTGHRDTEVHTNLEGMHMIGPVEHASPEKGLQSPQSLEVPLQTAYRGLLHKCPYCHYASRLSSNVKRHVRTHTGEMPYSCQQCDFRCKDASSMKRHQTVHARRGLVTPHEPNQNLEQL